MSTAMLILAALGASQLVVLLMLTLGLGIARLINWSRGRGDAQWVEKQLVIQNVWEVQHGRGRFAPRLSEAHMEKIWQNFVREMRARYGEQWPYQGGAK